MLRQYIPPTTTKIHVYIDNSGSAMDTNGGIRTAVNQIITTAYYMNVPVAFTVMSTEYNTGAEALTTPTKYDNVPEAVNFVMDAIGEPSGPFELQEVFRHINEDKDECNIFISDMILNIFEDRDNPGRLYVQASENNPECIPENPDGIWYLPVCAFKHEDTFAQCLENLKQYMGQHGIDISSRIMPAVNTKKEDTSHEKKN